MKNAQSLCSHTPRIPESARCVSPVVYTFIDVLLYMYRCSLRVFTTLWPFSSCLCSPPSQLKFVTDSSAMKLLTFLVCMCIVVHRRLLSTVMMVRKFPNRSLFPLLFYSPHPSATPERKLTIFVAFLWDLYTST